MFKIYGNNKQIGWEIIANRKTLEEAIKITNRLTSDNYYSYLIKETDENGDRIVKQESLYGKCEIEYVDNVKTNVEVRAMEFKVKEKERKPSRMKRKQEERKMFEEYIDR